MDLEKIVEACVVLGIDAICLCFVYKLYREKSRCLALLKSAQQLELAGDLKQKVKENGGTIPYAAITGKVAALAKPLVSEHSSVRGVIQEKITTEYKIRWIPTLHIWSSVDNNINRSLITVPFAICRRTGFFHKKTSIEISDPLSAEELVLSEVFNDYTKYEETFSEAIVSFISKEHTIGIRKVENMLLEGSPLTAVGGITIENDNLRMIPPENGAPYFLTPLSFESLCKKVATLTVFYKGLTVVLCCISSILLAYYVKRGFSELRRQIVRRRDVQRCKEAARLKQDTTSSGETGDSSPRCVVCLDRVVEVVILECGHACLCTSCSESIQSQCPVCRSSVRRIVPVFMP